MSHVVKGRRNRESYGKTASAKERDQSSGLVTSKPELGWSLAVEEANKEEGGGRKKSTSAEV